MRSDKSSMFFFAVKNLLLCDELQLKHLHYFSYRVQFNKKRKRHKKSTRAIYVNMKNAGIATVDIRCSTIVKCV